MIRLYSALLWKRNIFQAFVIVTRNLYIIDVFVLLSVGVWRWGQYAIKYVCQCVETRLMSEWPMSTATTIAKCNKTSIKDDKSALRECVCVQQKHYRVRTTNIWFVLKTNASVSCVCAQCLLCTDQSYIIPFITLKCYYFCRSQTWMPIYVHKSSALAPKPHLCCPKYSCWLFLGTNNCASKIDWIRLRSF